jgi:hypothetical protein
MAFKIMCSCGHPTLVTTGDAGATVRCPCGKDVAVPDLHALRQLKPVSMPTARNASAVVDPSTLRLRAMVVALAGTCVLVLGTATLLVLGQSTTKTDQLVTAFSWISLFSGLAFWFSMLVATVLLSRAKRLSFSSSLGCASLLVYLFGPLAFVVMLMLPDRDD